MQELYKDYIMVIYGSQKRYVRLCLFVYNGCIRVIYTYIRVA